MLKPEDEGEDLERAEKFGVEEFPAILFLDWQAKKKLGVIGEKPPEEIAAKLKAVAEKASR